MLTGEILLPEPRGEFGNASRGVVADALDHINEVGIRINAVQPAGNDQAFDDPDLFGAKLGPAEQPCLSAHRDATQCALKVMGVDRHIRIGQEYFEAQTSVSHLAERLNERIARRKSLPFELPLDPVEKDLDPGLAVGQSMLLLVVP